jgi:hypothetical protein
LGGTNLDRGALRLLLDGPNMPRPRSLDLGGNPFGDEGVEDLTRSPLLERVTDLSLVQCGLTDRAARALLASPHSRGCCYLAAWDNHFSAEVTQALKERFRGVSV